MVLYVRKLVKPLMSQTIYVCQVTEDFEEAQISSRGFGILDVGYRSKVRHLFHV